jgi:hypothetical protein
MPQFAVGGNQFNMFPGWNEMPGRWDSSPLRRGPFPAVPHPVKQSRRGNLPDGSILPDNHRRSSRLGSFEDFARGNTEGGVGEFREVTISFPLHESSLLAARFGGIASCSSGSKPLVSVRQSIAAVAARHRAATSRRGLVGKVERGFAIPLNSGGGHRSAARDVHPEPLGLQREQPPCLHSATTGRIG